MNTSLNLMIAVDDQMQSPIALVGEAGHPSLPYHAQGAAMSVEDGAVLGILLGKLDRSGRFGSTQHGRDVVSSILELYESIRKPRTAELVKAVDETRIEYCLPDGEAQRERDAFLADTLHQDWHGAAEWTMATRAFQKRIIGLNVLVDAETKFDQWMVYSKEKADLSKVRSR